MAADRLRPERQRRANDRRRCARVRVRTSLEHADNVQLGRARAHAVGRRADTPAWGPGDPPTAVRELRSWSTFDAPRQRRPARRCARADGAHDRVRPLRPAAPRRDDRRRDPTVGVRRIRQHRRTRTASSGGVVLRTFDSLNRTTALLGRRRRPTSGYTSGSSTGTADRPAQPAAERTAARAANTLGRLTRRPRPGWPRRILRYDFKGNMLEKSRQVISDDELLEVFGPPAPTDWNVATYSLDWRTAAQRPSIRPASSCRSHMTRSTG